MSSATLTSELNALSNVEPHAESSNYDRQQPGEVIIERRRFVSILGRCLTAGVAGVGVTTYELSAPDTEQVEYQPTSLDDVLAILKEHFPKMHFQTLQRAREHLVRSQQDVGTATATEMANRVITVLTASETPDGKPLVTRGFSEPVTFGMNYSLTRKEAESVPADQHDCNDHTQWTCEVLYENGIPVYKIAILAQDSKQGFRDLHHFAACKIHPNQFLIMQNAKHAITWNGTLEEYLQNYSTVHPNQPNVRLMHFGISRYVEPLHKNFAGRFAVQMANTASNEAEMIPIGLHQSNIHQLTHNHPTPHH